MTTLDNTIQWLEEEQRQQKAAVLKLQQQLDQIQGNSWTLSDRVNAVENAMNAVATHGAHVAHVEEELRQTRESIERLHTRLEEREQRDASEEHTSQVQYEREPGSPGRADPEASGHRKGAERSAGAISGLRRDGAPPAGRVLSACPGDRSAARRGR